MENISLRDRLALMYIQNTSAFQSPENPGFEEYINSITKEAYAFADAFLKNKPDE